MKYSEQLVWKAVGDILPGLLTAQETSGTMNLPSCLKLCAVECFLKNGSYPPFWTGDRNFAAMIIKEALKEIETIGGMTFGTLSGYSQI